MQDKTADSLENHTPLNHHTPEDDGQQEGAKFVGFRQIFVHKKIWMITGRG